MQKPCPFVGKKIAHIFTDVEPRAYIKSRTDEDNGQVDNAEHERIAVGKKVHTIVHVARQQ